MQRGAFHPTTTPTPIDVCLNLIDSSAVQRTQATKIMAVACSVLSMTFEINCCCLKNIVKV